MGGGSGGSGGVRHLEILSPQRRDGSFSKVPIYFKYLKLKRKLRRGKEKIHFY